MWSLIPFIFKHAWLWKVTIVGAQIWGGRDILARSQRPAGDPMYPVFLLCLSALPNMATCGEEQTARVSRRDARLLYIRFLACLGFFHRSLSYSKQSPAGPGPADTEAALNKPVAVIPFLFPLSSEKQMKDKCSGTHHMPLFRINSNKQLSFWYHFLIGHLLFLMLFPGIHW